MIIIHEPFPVPAASLASRQSNASPSAFRTGGIVLDYLTARDGLVSTPTPFGNSQQWVGVARIIVWPGGSRVRREEGPVVARVGDGSSAWDVVDRIPEPRGGRSTTGEAKGGGRRAFLGAARAVVMVRSGIELYRWLVRRFWDLERW